MTKEFAGEYFHDTGDLFLIYNSGPLARLTCARTWLPINGHPTIWRMSAMSAMAHWRLPLGIDLAVLPVGRPLQANPQEQTFAEAGQHVSEVPTWTNGSPDARMWPPLLAAQAARIAPQCKFLELARLSWWTVPI